MDGYGMVRNMIATNKSNLSRVGQRRSHKFESFDTSLHEPAFPELHPFEAQPVSQEYKAHILEQQLLINKSSRRKDLIAGIIAASLTAGFMTWFFGYVY